MGTVFYYFLFNAGIWLSVRYIRKRKFQDQPLAVHNFRYGNVFDISPRSSGNRPRQNESKTDDYIAATIAEEDNLMGNSIEKIKQEEYYFIFSSCI